MTELAEPEWRPPEEFEEYRLVRLLGRGAMGEVYLARDSLLDRPVAVKFVQAARDPGARARFLDEARAIARLQHPNVVAIHRIGEVAGHPYLVSEYVRGRPLDQLERPAASRQVLEIALHLARGLAAAHRCGVLHRDVKPANAILSDDGCAKLLDFGVASVLDGAAAELHAVAPPRERLDVAAQTQLAAMETTPSSQVRPVDRNASDPTSADSPAHRGAARPEHFVGTPLYMAPELWRGEPATRRSDLYSLGILLYELLAGAAPHRDVPIAVLGGVVGRRDITRIAEVAPTVEPALAAIVDRLVERDAGARFTSADALVVALEECAAPIAVASVPDGNPYRGLAAFESAHASLFFGRRSEIRELVHRVRSDAFVVVGGDSGTGKSSLCRAGVLPWLVDHDGWSRVDVVPGRHPVRALAAGLAGWLDTDEAALDALLRDTPDAFARVVRQHSAAAAGSGERRLLLFVDQLEELLTLSQPDEARVVAAALAALAVWVPSVRVLATARSDFLWRLAMLPGLGDELTRGLYFLRPLTGERIREVIVRPAAAKGVAFESEALVDTLVEQTELAPGGLPLLQFTLAEVWDSRDVGAKVIPARALDALGGVAGALTRHADRLLAGLDAEEREAARRILLRLVTAEGTRARRTEAELFGNAADRGAERAALEVLVRGRIVVANDVEHGAYEIAHEALLVSWSTLQGWLTRGAADHAVRRRVEQAAAEWERMGRPRELLWTRRRLIPTRALDREAMAPRELEFLARSRAAVARTRVFGIAVAASLMLAVVIIGVTIRARARRELESVIAGQVGAATTAFDDARRLAHQRDQGRARAFHLFDTRHWIDGERAWAEVEALAAQETTAYRAASSYLESALSLDPARGSLRALFAELTFERMLRAERDHHDDFAEELAGRLAAYDDGHHQSALDPVAHLELDVAPRGTRVQVHRTGMPPDLLGIAPLPRLTVPPGTLILELAAPGHVVTRLPVLLARGETYKQQIVLPVESTAPPGMIFVPPGRFLFGSMDITDLRRGFLNAPPEHEVYTEAYYIARYETTFAQWIEFLDDLTPEERRRRSPSSVNPQSSLTLSEIGPRRWQLALTPTTRTYVAETGQPVRYEHRTKRAVQDWSRFPVSAVSYDDATAYVRWLDRTGRVPGARLCDEYEWERAARGADGRTFPSGNTLGPDDANIDVTYGRDPLAFGPDEVGSHPASRSPIGAEDMAGNVWEWTRSVESPDAPVARGGGWYYAEVNSRSVNREHGEPTERNMHMGVRVCATPR
ncbi:MAG TPA: SUMF1/EgtB/PvdO family nonheme iron enzyme [Kofleriaceae bacterium]|nr:SUMF1/EgtB/PvdO family nonheme iron enzyme [Kofleriaceae bacterium]